MDNSAIVRSELLLRGLDFIEESGAFQFTMKSGGKIWRSLISVGDEDIVCCAQFPWNAAKSALETLDSLNREVRLGCFFLKDGHVLYRCGAAITDPFAIGENAISLVRLNGGVVCRYWERVMCCGGSNEL
ncbi:MAG: hypothetical protein J6B57_03825 [Oscillospiraceae bacterium]|nr:hypothetical protein [Oscillospiraceae bacterium]